MVDVDSVSAWFLFFVQPRNSSECVGDATVKGCMDYVYFSPPWEVAEAAGLDELWLQVLALRRRGQGHYHSLETSRFILAHAPSYVTAHVTIPYMINLPDAATVLIFRALLPDSSNEACYLIDVSLALVSTICSAPLLSVRCTIV